MLDLVPLANAGTPLIWLGCGTLIFGNFFLGLFETWLLKRLFKVEIAPGWLVVANYVSMIAGAGLLSRTESLRQSVYQAPFDKAVPFLHGSWVAAFFLTVLFEWPFYSALSGKWGFKSVGLKYSLLVNTASYMLLTLVASFVAQTNAVTGIDKVSLSQLRPPEGWIYYVARDAKEIRRIRTDGTKMEKIANLPRGESRSGSWMRLTIEPNKQGIGDLYFRYSSDRILVKADVAPKGFFALARKSDDQGAFLIGNETFGYGNEATLSWKPNTTTRNGFWAAEGLTVNGKRYALETPMLSIAWRSVTELPNGMLVANFGDQIVIFDPKTETVAPLVQGFGAAVALDAKP